MERVDFCVLGGGPAGLAFATLAARAGARVFVVERTRYDRPRPGEHLAGAIRPALALLGVPRAAAAAILEQSPGIITAWGTPLPVTKSYGGRPDGTAFNADRRCFDCLLGDTAATAGAICLPAARLAEATRVAGASWQIHLATSGGSRRIAAGFVVDASGRRAVFARRQGAAQRRAGDLVALTTWYAAAQSRRRAAAQPLVVAAGGPGWWSLTATPDQGYAATFYTSADFRRRSHGRGADVAAAVSHLAPVVANRLAQAAAVELGRRTFACCPQVTVPMHGPGWIAVGEAAAAFDPICGRGVAYALETALRAFEAIVAAAARLGAEYEAALRECVDDHLTARRRVYSEAAGRLDAQFLERACFPGFA